MATSVRTESARRYTILPPQGTLTLGARVEGVVVNIVVATSETDANTVLHVDKPVVVDLGVGRL